METEKVTSESKILVTKVILLRGVTIAEPPVWDPSSGDDPPTFAAGDVVQVPIPLAQAMVGNGRARFFDEKAAEAAGVEGPVTTASLAAPEDTADKARGVRKAAAG